MVKASTQYGPPIGLHSELFVLVNENMIAPNWKIRLHQSLD